MDPEAIKVDIVPNFIVQLTWAAHSPEGRSMEALAEQAQDAVAAAVCRPRAHCDTMDLRALTTLPLINAPFNL